VVSYALALVAVALTVLGQLCLKAAAMRGVRLKHFGVSWPMMALLALGYGSIVVAVLVTTRTLRLLEFNVVVSMTALCYPLVIGLSGIAFSERLTHRQWLGLITICCGVAVYNLG